MKKIYLISILALTVFASACTKQLGSPAAQADFSSKIPVYEQGLKDYAAGIKEFAPQAADISSMDPSVMFAYSHSRVAAEDFDQAVFWYYLAQYRAIVLYNAVDGDMITDNDYFSKVYTESGLTGMPYIIGTVSKQMLYRAIMQTYGKTITQIGIRDVKKTAEIICAALNYEQKHKFKVAKAAGDTSVKNVLQIQKQKKRVRTALIDFIKDLQKGEPAKKQYLK